MMDALDAAAKGACRILAFVAGILMVAMMVLACANMLLRAVWSPVPGAFELMGFFGAVAAAFSLGYAQISKSHIAVGLLVRHFHRPVRRALDAASSLLSCAFFGLAGIEAFKWAAFLVRTGELSETLRFVYHPFVFATALGCLVIALALFADFLRAVSGREAC
ncbi:MAG: TRAP transporter small permease [Desulfovibrionaceae bacterium]|nr:TRAP transporter small permease [Desulfovibrionaceae bacterium]